MSYSGVLEFSASVGLKPGTEEHWYEQYLAVRIRRVVEAHGMDA